MFDTVYKEDVFLKNNNLFLALPGLFLPFLKNKISNI